MHSKNYAQAQPNKYCIHCALEVKAQVQNNAAVSKDRKAIQIYAQLQPGKYCINCVLEMKAQVRSSAVVSKKKISKPELCTGTTEGVQVKSVQWFRRKDKQVRTMHGHSQRSVVFVGF